MAYQTPGPRPTFPAFRYTRFLPILAPRRHFHVTASQIVLCHLIHQHGIDPIRRTTSVFL